MAKKPTTSFTDLRAAPVPSGRVNRLLRLGGMAGGVVGRMAFDGARGLAAGRRPQLKDMLLTPANAARVADELARMRGAAMKVGQLLSLEAGDFLPPELSDILARLRASADPMPPRQLKQVLSHHWGADFLRLFTRFDVTPIAAASIGQVHRAWTRDGRDLAIKVQYPGVRRSIDSDVDNLASLIRVSGLAPPGVDLAPLLAEAKRQLHEEADYEREGAQLALFHDLLRDDARYVTPARHADLTTPDILAMDFIDSAPIERLAEAPQADRDRAAADLIRLALREVFEFQRAQTDPNFANYRYRPGGPLVLLDFGATREISDDAAAAYRRLLAAALTTDRAALAAAARAIGAFDDAVAPHHQEMIIDLISIVGAALAAAEPVNFADGPLAAALRTQGMALAQDRTLTHIPPIETLFLQRKLAGLFLLAARLKARVALGPLVAPYAAHATALTA